MSKCRGKPQSCGKCNLRPPKNACSSKKYISGEPQFSKWQESLFYALGLLLNSGNHWKWRNCCGKTITKQILKSSRRRTFFYVLHLIIFLCRGPDRGHQQRHRPGQGVFGLLRPAQGAEERQVLPGALAAAGGQGGQQLLFDRHGPVTTTIGMTQKKSQRGRQHF